MRQQKARDPVTYHLRFYGQRPISHQDMFPAQNDYKIRYLHREHSISQQEKVTPGDML